MLTRVSRRGSLHMPGHKGFSPFGAVDAYALDTTELPVTDDLYSPTGALMDAQRRYAACAGSGASIFLHNGSTCGVHAMLQLYAREGDTVLLPRNAHLSAVNACILGGLRPVWMPVTQRADGYCYLREETVLEALARCPEAKAVLVTSPDYYGCCLPLERIARAAHAQGTRLVVDEAHGAHLPWLDAHLSASRYADAWVQSVHKTLPGLTGAAVLHLADARDREAALRLIRREQTSSPSFLLMLSIDDARAFMEREGASRLRAVCGVANGLRARLASLGYRDAHEAWADTGMRFDPTRLVIDAPQGGPALLSSLAARGLDAEMCDWRRVVVILSAMDDETTVARLEEALRAIWPVARDIPPPAELPALPPRRMSPREAAMAPCEAVPLDRAEGRVAAQAAGLYPPGIPLVCPGEELTREIAQRLIRHGDRQLFGVEGERLVCVRQSSLTLTER